MTRRAPRMLPSPWSAGRLRLQAAGVSDPADIDVFTAVVEMFLADVDRRRRRNRKAKESS